MVLAAAEGCKVPVILAAFEAVLEAVAEGALESKTNVVSAGDGLAEAVVKSESREVSVMFFTTCTRPSYLGHCSAAVASSYHFSVLMGAMARLGQVICRERRRRRFVDALSMNVAKAFKHLRYTIVSLDLQYMLSGVVNSKGKTDTNFLFQVQVDVDIYDIRTLWLIGVAWGLECIEPKDCKGA